MLTAFYCRDVAPNQLYLSCGKYAGIYAANILTSKTLATISRPHENIHISFNFNIPDRL